MTQDVIDRPAPGVAIPRLTRRESIVLRELHRGLTLDEIADRLYVSRNTIKTQVRSLYRKLGVSSRGEAVALVNRRREGVGPAWQRRLPDSEVDRTQQAPQRSATTPKGVLSRRVTGAAAATGGGVRASVAVPMRSTAVGGRAGAGGGAPLARPGGPHVSACWEPGQPAIVWVPSCAALVQLARQRDAAREALDAIESAIAVEVRGTRARGANWSDIGGALGMTRQAVRRRFDDSQQGG